MRASFRGSGSNRHGVPEQVVRLSIVFAFLIAAVLIVRAYAIPDDLKEVGLHHRSAIEREVARPIRYAGARPCAECHEEVVALKEAGHHRTLSCETCHGPSQLHVKDPMKVKPEAPRLRTFCPICHAYDPSRPTGFPQINAATHNPLRPCIQCHQPHAPAPSETPRECGACHGEIERTKAVSAHALLGCTTCHETPEEHRKDPRSTRPSKPRGREFCGGCHREGAGEKLAPKVDLATHGEKYLCWDCHYPHLPEGR